MNKTIDEKSLVANNMTYYRKAAGFTQAELAEKLSYSDKAISKWERAEGFPDIFVLKKLADIYGVSVNDFFKEKPKKYYSGLFKKRVINIGISFGIVWLTTLVVFALCVFIAKSWSDPWILFIYGAIATGIVLTSIAGYYKWRFWKLIGASMIIWTTATGFHLTWFICNPNAEYIWLSYIIAIPIELIVILWYFLKIDFKKYFKKKDKEKLVEK